jgi:formyltetrahydrofolate-dependent phosphoribosylglycinamide formyltransferase
MSSPLKIAIFASGRGSNVQAIVDNIINGSLQAQIVCLISNKSTAGALEIARAHDIPAFHLSSGQFANEEEYAGKLSDILKSHHAQLIVLAGYLKKMPVAIIREFRTKVINSRPALLPSFGGQGMYGHFVHEAVLNYGCKVSGATVHLVDEEYDTGTPIIQQCVPVLEDDTADTLAERVLKIEHQIFSQAIQLYAENRIIIQGRRIKIKERERD